MKLVNFNENLAEIQESIHESIRYENLNQFIDSGGSEQTNLNFKINLNPHTQYYPIQLASVRGCSKIIKEMIKNPTVDIHVVDQETGVNCFWLAAFYGNWTTMKILAENGIDVMNVHNKT